MLANLATNRVLTNVDYVSTGVTLIDLASSGRIGCGLAKGYMYRLAGRTQACKSVMGRTILAEAAINPSFDGYELIYDDIEHSDMLNISRLFGEKMLKRMVPPARNAKTKTAIHSYKVSDFFRRITERLEKGKKFIWMADSLDSLVPDHETKMGDGKAKVYSQELRRLVDPIAATGSILILMSQSRVDMRSLFGGDITSGGRALEHYTTLEIWLRKIKTLKVIYKGKKIPTGTLVSAHIKKNRISGKDRAVVFPFSPEYGIDDIGANVDFLTGWKHWQRTKDGQKTVIEATELNLKGTRNWLLGQIEQEDKKRELQILVGKVWHDIDKAVAVQREPRYQ